MEEMTASDIWTANKFIKEPVGDGGSPRIPTIHTTKETGQEEIINNHEDKAKIFAKTFFLPPPKSNDDYAD